MGSRCDVCGAPYEPSARCRYCRTWRKPVGFGISAAEAADRMRALSGGLCAPVAAVYSRTISYSALATDCLSRSLVMSHSIADSAVGWEEKPHG